MRAFKEAGAGGRVAAQDHRVRRGREARASIGGEVGGGLPSAAAVAMGLGEVVAGCLSCGPALASSQRATCSCSSARRASAAPGRPPRGSARARTERVLPGEVGAVRPDELLAARARRGGPGHRGPDRAAAGSCGPPPRRPRAAPARPGRAARCGPRARPGCWAGSRRRRRRRPRAARGTAGCPRRSRRSGRPPPGAISPAPGRAAARRPPGARRARARGSACGAAHAGRPRAARAARRRRSRIGCAAEKMARYSTRSSSVGSAQWTSSTHDHERALAPPAPRAAGAPPRPSPPACAGPSDRPSRRSTLRAAGLVAASSVGDALAPAQLRDDLGQRPVGHVLAVGGAAAGDDRRVERRGELVREPRLADPGRPDTLTSRHARSSRGLVDARAAAELAPRPTNGPRAGGRARRRSSSSRQPAAAGAARRSPRRGRARRRSPSEDLAGRGGRLQRGRDAERLAGVARRREPPPTNTSPASTPSPHAAPASRSSSAARTARSASSSCSSREPEHADHRVAAPTPSTAPPWRSITARRRPGRAGVQRPRGRAARRGGPGVRATLTSRRAGRLAAGAGAGRVGARRGRGRRRRQRRILREDRPLERAQPLARLDPELVDERAARVLVGLQRVGLAVAAVEREHQLAAQPLAVRVLGDQRLAARRPARRGGRARAAPRRAPRAPRPAAPPAARARGWANGS